MLVALIATASLSYLQFDSGDILLIAATIPQKFNIVRFQR
jgi:hypothetical protein